MNNFYIQIALRWFLIKTTLVVGKNLKLNFVIQIR